MAIPATVRTPSGRRVSAVPRGLRVMRRIKRTPDRRADLRVARQALWPRAFWAILRGSPQYRISLQRVSGRLPYDFGR